MAPSRPVELQLPTDLPPDRDVSEPIWDDGNNHAGIYQRHLNDPTTVPRTGPEAYYHHAIKYGGYHALYEMLANVDVANDTWWPLMFDAGDRIEHTWQHLDQDYRGDRHGLLYLAQHPYEIWDAIILGTLPRLQDEGWCKRYIDFKMGIAVTPGPGCYLNIIAASKMYDDAGKLTEEAGRFISQTQLRHIIACLRRYIRCLKSKDPSDREWCGNVDTVHDDTQEAPDTPKYLNGSPKVVATRTQELNEMIKYFEEILSTMDPNAMTTPIWRCVRESGQTSQPMLDRAKHHRYNAGTTFAYGLLNSIMRLEFGDIYFMVRQYAVIYNWDPLKKQVVMEAMLHFVASTALELGGTNIEKVKAGKQSVRTAPYDLVWRQLFDVDMLKRLNDEYDYYARLYKTAKEYDPIAIAEMDKKIAQQDQELEAGKIRIAEKKALIKKTEEELEALVAEDLKAQNYDRDFQDRWQTIMKLCKAITADRAKPLQPDNELRRKLDEKTQRMVPVDSQFEAQRDTDRYLGRFSKFIPGQGEDYQPPEGWTTIDDKGRKTFRETSTSRETSMPPHRLLSLSERSKQGILATLSGIEESVAEQEDVRNTSSQKDVPDISSQESEAVQEQSLIEMSVRRQGVALRKIVQRLGRTTANDLLMADLSQDDRSTRLRAAQQILAVELGKDTSVDGRSSPHISVEDRQQVQLSATEEPAAKGD